MSVIPQYKQNKTETQETNNQDTSHFMHSATSCWPLFPPPRLRGISFELSGSNNSLKITTLNTFLKCVPSPCLLNQAGFGCVSDSFMPMQSPLPEHFSVDALTTVSLPVCTSEADSSQKPALYHLPSEHVPSPDDTVLFFVLCVRLN